ncbi:magnetosome protein Mad28-2 [Candidatus Magnetoovum chiemensis]|nr:magnetosome protein Mad28-2 [Candidatus Magnetoovum chiemensis]
MEESNEFLDYRNEIERLKSRMSEMKEEKELQPSKDKAEESVLFGASRIDRDMEAARQASYKDVLVREKLSGEKPETPTSPVGLDVGTSNIVAALNKGSDIHLLRQVNAFFTVNESKFAKKIFAKNDVIFSEKDSKYYIVGYAAEGFANMFNENTKRPMFQGIISSKEDESLYIMQAIINSLITKPKNFGETICFTVPGEPVDLDVSLPDEDKANRNITGYTPVHASIIEMYLESLGYTPISINEGLAVVMSELGEENFTGIGISMGGGMCNVCLSYLSVPVVTYSIRMGGDYIDTMVSKDTKETATKVKVIKELSFNLMYMPKNRLEIELFTRYSEVMTALVKSMEQVFSLSERIPKISSPIPIVLAGGTAMPKGCKERFENILKSVSLPFKVSEITVAKDPLSSVAKGALIMALSSEETK